jgi:hypothetical protein
MALQCGRKEKAARHGAFQMTRWFFERKKEIKYYENTFGYIAATAYLEFTLAPCLFKMDLSRVRSNYYSCLLK